MKPIYEVIITDNVTADLTNPELKANIKEMMIALSKGKSAVWQYAFAVHKIINEGQFEDDFGTLKEFAKFAKTSTATLSQYDKAVDFVCRRGFVQYELQRNGKKLVDFKKIPWTVSNAYLASTLNDEEYDRLVAFAPDVDLSSLSQNKLKALISEWKLSEHLEDCINVSTPEPEPEAEPCGEPGTEEAQERELGELADEQVSELTEEMRIKAIQFIQVLVKKFSITYSELVHNIQFPPEDGIPNIFSASENQNKGTEQ